MYLVYSILPTDAASSAMVKFLEIYSRENRVCESAGLCGCFFYVCVNQGLSQESKIARLKPQFQNFCPSRYSFNFRSLQVLCLIPFCVKKGNLHFSNVIEDGLLGKYLIITPKKVKIGNSSFKYLPFQKVGFQETVSKRRAGQVLAKRYP